ncbi:MAG: AraC family transcriptional regulator [Verrucomicrobiales bacterium]|nr:AraC family transcriptional regulator [Verrucomicrobiales bacterium]
MSEPEMAVISLVPEGEKHQVVGERKVILPGINLEIWTTRMIALSRWELHGLNDPFWRLYIPVKGGAKITVDGDQDRIESTLRVGEAYIIPPHTTMFSETSGEFAKWYVHFTLGHRGDRVSPGIFPVEMTGVMEAAVKNLSNLEAGAYPWASLNLVGEALKQLPGSVWSFRKLDHRVETAIEFMHVNLGRKLVAREVAAAAGVSVRNLNHLFQHHLGKSPMNVLLDFRLNQACRLLRHSNISIDQIAEDCGFPNRYYFSRMMKQVRSTSPAAYRKAEF